MHLFYYSFIKYIKSNHNKIDNSTIILHPFWTILFLKSSNVYNTTINNHLISFLLHYTTHRKIILRKIYWKGVNLYFLHLFMFMLQQKTGPYNQPQNIISFYSTVEKEQQTKSCYCQSLNYIIHLLWWRSSTNYHALHFDNVSNSILSVYAIWRSRKISWFCVCVVQ